MRSFLAMPVFLMLATLAGCGSKEDIPFYPLPQDLSLRIYKGNEQATFSIDGQYTDSVLPVNIDGEIYLNWQPSDASHSAITALNGINLLTEQWKSNIPNIPPIFIQRHFWQKSDGQIVYAGFTLRYQGETYWAAAKNQTPAEGIATLVSPLTEDPLTLNYDLWQCQNICSTKVAEVTESYEFRRYDTIKTPYAAFETLNYAFNMVISDVTGQGGLNITISGQNWIYPPLGPVKISRLILQDGHTINFIGLLAATNVPLPKSQ